MRVNERIRVPQVRLIGPDGSQLGIVPIERAREIAMQNELDIVEVAAQSVPPVCRIMDFAKFKYDQEKKEREAKKHQKQARLKEIRLHPNIDPHDLGIKIKQAIGFLKDKDRVKVDLFFRGRQMEHMDLGRRILDKFIAETQSEAQLDKDPTQEGRVLTMTLMPKK